MATDSGFSRRHFVGITIGGACAAGLGAAAGITLSRKDEPPGVGDRFTYDLQPLLAVDPARVGYELTATLAAGLQGASALAVTGRGEPMVAIGREVHVIVAQQRRPICTVSSVVQALHPQSDGSLWLARRDGVEQRDPAGKVVRAWSPGGAGLHLTSLAVSGAHVVVADAGQRRVSCHDVSGERRWSLGGPLREGGALFVVPSPYFDVAIDAGAGGRVWVANTGRHRVESYALADGKALGHWGRAGMAIEDFCGCCNPSHLALLADGRFLTTEKGLPRVKVYDASGQLETVVAPPAAFDVASLDPAAGADPDSAGPLVSVGPDGSVLVLYPRQGELRLYRTKQVAG